MRTIKFRGQRVDNGEWVYGDLMHYVMGEDQLVYTTSIRSAIIYQFRPICCNVIRFFGHSSKVFCECFSIGNTHQNPELLNK